MTKRLGIALHRLCHRKDAFVSSARFKSRRGLLAQVEVLEGKTLLSSSGLPRFSAMGSPNAGSTVHLASFQRSLELSAKQYPSQVAFVNSLAAVSTAVTVTPEVITGIQTSMSACFNSKTPDAQLVSTLANDYKAASYDGKFTYLERVKLRADLTAVLISAGVKPIEMQRALAQAKSHYSDPSITPDAIRVTLRNFTVITRSVFHAPRFS